MPHLVLADDNKDIQRVVELSFADENVSVHCFGDGVQALEYVSARPVDVLVLDVSLPRIDGYEFCRQVKANPVTAHIPVVLLVSSFDSFDEERARQCGSQNHLVKPFETSRLIALVKGLLVASTPITLSEQPKGDGQLGEGLLFQIPIENGIEENVFSLTPSQCRPVFGLLQRHITSLKAEGQAPSGREPISASSEGRASPNTEQLDQIMDKVLERFPEELRRLVPEIVQTVIKDL